jgi:hypothetical protein
MEHSPLGLLILTLVSCRTRLFQRGRDGEAQATTLFADAGRVRN